MATKRTPEKARATIGRALHKHYKKRFEGLPEADVLPSCPACGQSMEVNLWKKLECGYCLGYRVAKDNNGNP